MVLSHGANAGQPSTAPQTTETKNYRHRKVRFEILPDGKHEHNFINIRTEATMAPLGGITLS